MSGRESGQSGFPGKRSRTEKGGKAKITGDLGRGEGREKGLK